MTLAEVENEAAAGIEPRIGRVVKGEPQVPNHTMCVSRKAWQCTASNE